MCLRVCVCVCAWTVITGTVQQQRCMAPPSTTTIWSPPTSSTRWPRSPPPPPPALDSTDPSPLRWHPRLRTSLLAMCSTQRIRFQHTCIRCFIPPLSPPSPRGRCIRTTPAAPVTSTPPPPPPPACTPPTKSGPSKPGPTSTLPREACLCCCEDLSSSSFPFRSRWRSQGSMYCFVLQAVMQGIFQFDPGFGCRRTAFWISILQQPSSQRVPLDMQLTVGLPAQTLVSEGRGR